MLEIRSDQSIHAIHGHATVEDVEGTRCSLYLDTALQCSQRSSGNDKLVSMIHFCSEIDEGDNNMPLALEDIYRFYKMVESTKRKLNGSAARIVLCCGQVPRIQFGTIFLLGSYMLVSGKRISDLCNSFSKYDSILERFRSGGLGVHDFWCSLAKALRIGWVRFVHMEEEEETILARSVINMDEYCHYSR